MKKFLLMDGSSIFYRAFYAMPPLTASTGELTSAIQGFANIVLKIFGELNPEAAAIALDVGKKTFRNDLFTDYKSNREQAPAELSSQFPLLDEFATTLGIKTVGIKNYEADDIIGTLATQAADQNFNVIIVTGDRDAFQLINQNISVAFLKNVKSHNASYTIYNVDTFYNEYGFKPARLVDFKGLCGDKSDNIPGIKGIGEKTATKLIRDFDTIENVFDNINRVESKSIRTKLVDAHDIAMMSKQLAIINRNVPNVTFNADSFIVKPNLQRADQFCSRYELRLIKKKIHELFDSTENLFGVDNAADDQPLPPYAIDPPFVYNLKAIYHARITIDSNEIYDVDLMNYLVNAGSPVTLRPSLKEVGQQLVDKLDTDNMLNLYHNVELPLVKVLANMEDRGVYVNADHLNQKSNDMAERLNEIEQNIYTLAGEDFNINSPKQLADILFNKLGLTPIKRTKTGFSTNAEVLEELRDKHLIVESILNYRAIAKLKSTFVDSIKALINPNTHRVHTHFNQTVTATGRLSSSDPNLQNIPVRTAEGREIRALFEPGDGYDLIVSADYSQIELRLLAHMSGDENLIDAFNKNQDIHARTAAEVFGVDLDQVTPDMRRHAKAINFGIIYGMSDFGLSRDLKIPRKDAADYIEKYFARYPGVKSFLDETIAAARQSGYVTTMFGRRRTLPMINSSNFNQRTLAERMAMNTPIQGSAADIIKLAMIATENNLSAAGLNSRMILQVHDELVIETVRAELDKVMQIVRQSMENATSLKIPLVVDVAAGANWAAAK